MRKIIATISKELLLLRRDRAGLLVLFVMPALLVLVMTLVQENVFKTMGESTTRILFIDHDGEEVGRAIEKKLVESGGIEIVRTIAGKTVDEKEGLRRVLSGEFQLCVLIPAETTVTLKSQVRRSMEESLEVKKKPAENTGRLSEINVYFDPTVFGGFRSAVLSSLELAIAGIEMNEKMSVLSQLLPRYIDQTIRNAMGPMLPEGGVPDFSGKPLDFTQDRLLQVADRPASLLKDLKKPTSVQQNVPAWALFGIFFVALPMAGGLIRERQDETLARLLTLPVSPPSLMIGKIIAYVLVCLGQFALILFIGKMVLPLLGTPKLEMGSDPIALTLIAFSAILAATGFGILLGMVARTYEQASMVGPIAIVIAAALGGIMVPVYAMPAIMRKISVYSPLEWGHSAFLEVFVRGGDIQAVGADILALLAFFVASILTAWLCFTLRGRRGA